jgi:hypothetical protein
MSIVPPELLLLPLEPLLAPLVLALLLLLLLEPQAAIASVAIARAPIDIALRSLMISPLLTPARFALAAHANAAGGRIQARELVS